MSASVMFGIPTQSDTWRRLGECFSYSLHIDLAPSSSTY
ncbi:hypothetical protein CGRA01v4_02357 [Colletotrichum graminicola]|nr:hypothetical protein CGRA01v4_02357 [Colletotrichum graminicola]